MESTVVSDFFTHNINVGSKFLDIINELNNSLEHVQLPPEVQCVYKPTIYARHTFEMYVQIYCNTQKDIMYFGMNPGPWGMSQTGVPFGEVNSVRDWLQIEGPVDKPQCEISPRPVQGFECKRSEISGKRFWGLFRSVCGTPENFFNSSFVYNYLPQQWMKQSGCNLTPSDFRVSQMQSLYQVCDPIFVKVLQLYEVKTVVAVGKFCENRAKKALEKYYPGNSIKILYLPHPSPRTVNNTNWNEKARDYLKSLDLLKFYTMDLFSASSTIVKMVDFMDRALELAKEALAAHEVPVGCVFTVDGTVVAESRNSVNVTHNPTRHAEINCIDQIIQYCSINNIPYQEYCKKICVYVTVEPCIMCASALNNLNVSEVVYGCANDRFGGKTVLDVSQFYDNSYVLTGNVRADDAMALLKEFYKGTNPNAPKSKAKNKQLK